MKNKIIEIIISLVVLSGLVWFLAVYIKDSPRCQDGNQLDELLKDNIIYLECGQDKVTEDFKEVEGDEIVLKSVVTQEAEHHIETYDLNWTSKWWAQLIAVIAAIGSFFYIAWLLAIIIGYH